MSVQRTVDVGERLPLLQSIPLSLQHLFAMFGATVLVPYLVGLDTSVTLFSSGVGTLLYILITKGKIPAYLGSSFAFIGALTVLLGVKPGQLADAGHIAVAMGGCVVVGLIYIAVSFAIAKFGTGWIERLLPPVVIGSVVVVIGLGLARVAVAHLVRHDEVADVLGDDDERDGTKRQHRAPGQARQDELRHGEHLGRSSASRVATWWPCSWARWTSPRWRRPRSSQCRSSCCRA